MFQPTRTQDACSFHSSSRSESEPWSPHCEHQKTDGARTGSSDHRSLASAGTHKLCSAGRAADSLSLKEFLVRRRQKVVNGRQFVEAAGPEYRGVAGFVRCDPFAIKSRRTTMKRESPGLLPGAPELSLILGSGQYGGVSGDGVPCSQRANSSNITVRGWGCYPVRLTATFGAGALPIFHCALWQRTRYFRI
jgi:hypothetical protein